MLPEAERSTLRHKWRGMGMIQHKAKQVRECWRARLAQLRRAMLEEHSRCLVLLYEGVTLPGTGPCLQLTGSPERAISREHWLACDDIARLWKALTQGAALDMDHPVAYDMVLDYICHVRRGYDSAGSRPDPGMEEGRRCHYVIVNSTRSNQEGNHWGLGLWDGRRRPDSLTLVDPYADASRFQAAKSAAMAIGLRVKLLGAGQQTCGWRCGYICLWWALSIGNKGETPSPEDLPHALPKMQKAFPVLCQSLLRGRDGRDRPGGSKRERSPETVESLATDVTICAGNVSLTMDTAGDQDKASLACSTVGKVPALGKADPGFDPQRVHVSPGNWNILNSSHSLDPVYISPDDWTLSNLSNLSNSSSPQNPDGNRVEYSQSMVTQGRHLSEPPDTGLGRRYIYISPLPHQRRRCSNCTIYQIYIPPLPRQRRRRISWAPYTFLQKTGLYQIHQIYLPHPLKIQMGTESITCRVWPHRGITPAGHPTCD